MSHAAAQALAKLEPEGLAPEGPGWQQRKSSQTRTQILEAAIDCLAEYGYARTTTQLIAQVAEISRGAMLHHYATKQDLIAAVIDYAFYKRLENYSRRVRELTEVQRMTEFAGVDVSWEMCGSREYRAYLELAIASQTDAELSALFTPKAHRYDRVWRDEIVKVFPEWGANRELLDLSVDYVIALLEGLWLNRDVWNAPERSARLRNWLKLTLQMLRDGQLSFPPATPPLAQGG